MFTVKYSGLHISRQNDAVEGRVRERKGIPDYLGLYYSSHALSQPPMRLQPFASNTNLAKAVPQVLISVLKCNK